MTAKTPSESAPAQSATPLSAVGLSGTGRSIVQPVRIELSVRTAQNQEHLHWVREAGQGPVMHSIRPNSKIGLRIDGQEVSGNQKVKGQSLLLKKVNADLLIETETGETLVTLENFYQSNDVLLQGADWSFSGNDQLHVVNANEGVMASSLSQVSSGNLMPVTTSGVGWLGLGGAVAAAASDGGTAAAAIQKLSINVVAGPVNTKLTVLVYAADGTLLGAYETAADGSKIDIPLAKDGKPYTGALMVKVVDLNQGDGAGYMDESTGLSKDLGIDLRALAQVVAGKDLAISITPATEIATKLALGNNDTPTAASPLTTEAVMASNTKVASSLGLSDILGSATPIISTAGGANSAYNEADGLSESEKYGQVLAMLSGKDLVMAYSLNGNTTSGVSGGANATLFNSPTYGDFRALSLSADTGQPQDYVTKTADQTIRATLSSALSAGDILEGSVNGTTWTDITNKVSGTSITWTGAQLLAGSNSIAFRVKDLAGNVGANIGTTNYVLDTTAPTTTAAITGITDNVGVYTGNVASGTTTDDTSLVLRGSLGGATAGASLASGETLRIYDGATYLGSATVTVVAGGQSTWSFTDTRPLTNTQAVSYTARVADLALNEGTASSAYTVTIDTAAPTATLVSTNSTSTFNSGNDGWTLGTGEQLFSGTILSDGSDGAIISKTIALNAGYCYRVSFQASAPQSRELVLFNAGTDQVGTSANRIGTTGTFSSSSLRNFSFDFRNLGTGLTFSSGNLFFNGQIDNVNITEISAPSTNSVNVQSTESGTAYLVRSDVSVTNISSITSAADALWNAMNVTANTQVSMSLAGLQDGTYRLYTADAAGNLSSATSNTLLVSSSTTPLVLDLNGDGVRTTDVAHGVRFDVNNTGSPLQTGWVDAHDGLLVLDLNRDGIIQNGSELFGSGTTLSSTSGKATDGYEALRQYDLNHDSVIDVQDAVFKDLQVWQDSNTNGVSDAGELRSLASLGIASLDLNAVAGTQVDKGNTLGLVSGWTDTLGQNHAMADVWFNTTSPADLASQAAAHLVVEQNAKVFAC